MKCPSRRVLIWIVISVLGLFVALGLPRLVLPRFANRLTTVAFQVHILDDQGIPIPNANVSIGPASAKSDLEGFCQVPHDCLAKGIKGVSGTCRLEGEMRVEAPGYISWKGSLPDLFGQQYDYVEKGTNIQHQVTLFR